MNVLEYEIEDLIYGSLKNNPDRLRKKGLHLFKNSIRQLNLGSYGIADLVCYHNSHSKEGSVLNIQVVEIKKDYINADTIMQASRYVAGIRRLLDKRFNLKRTSLFFTIVLIGREIQVSGDFVFLLDAFGEVSAYTYSIDLDEGVKFQRQSGWFMSDETFGTSERVIREHYKNTFKLNG